MAIFDRLLLKQNRNRVADKFVQADFIYEEILEIIIQTILDCQKNFTRNFNNILEIGARTGSLGRKIFSSTNSKQLIQTDLSHKMAIKNNLNLVMDDELLCFSEQSFDLIISNLNLHSINDIPQNLTAIKNLLKPNGVFIASFFGEENLKELKEVFMITEQKLYNCISPRIFPNIDIKSAGMLLQRAGFKDVVCEKHSFEVNYSDLKKLFIDLRNMGETNILNARSRKFITKNFLFNLTNLYKKLYCSADQKLVATFEIIILIGKKR